MAKVKEIKKLPYGREINKLIKDLKKLSTICPSELREVLLQNENLLKNTKLYKHEEKTNKYIALVGLITPGAEKDYQKIAKDAGIDNVRFFNDLNSIKNSRVISHFRNESCMAVVFGIVPHKINGGDPKDVLGDKYFEARLASAPNKNPKLTHSAFKCVIVSEKFQNLIKSY